jgi:hypothetical protein
MHRVGLPCHDQRRVRDGGQRVGWRRVGRRRTAQHPRQHLFGDVGVDAEGVHLREDLRLRKLGQARGPIRLALGLDRSSPALLHAGRRGPSLPRGRRGNTINAIAGIPDEPPLTIADLQLPDPDPLGRNCITVPATR